MYQGSREFLSIWYPIKDYEEMQNVITDRIPDETEVAVSVEKSNFTQSGKVRLKYIPEYCSFEDLN